MCGMKKGGVWYEDVSSGMKKRVMVEEGSGG